MITEAKKGALGTTNVETFLQKLKPVLMKAKRRETPQNKADKVEALKTRKGSLGTTDIGAFLQGLRPVLTGRKKKEIPVDKATRVEDALRTLQQRSEK